MKLEDFDFALPEELIALRPARPRTQSRLLVSQGDKISDAVFSDLKTFLKPGDRLVLNNTKVRPARLTGLRTRRSDAGTTQARIEVTLLSPDQEGDWLALGKPSKRVKTGEVIDFAPDFSARLIEKSPDGMKLRFNKTGDAFDTALEINGSMPLPPYIAAKRETDKHDMHDYQTVFAKELGAVAAPTASLHFDDELLGSLKQMGVETTEVTLHVGAGTFLPVKVDNISDHKMHSEWGEVSEIAAHEIFETQRKGGRIIPVGTTALRLIETAAKGGEIRAWTGETDIFITPGFDFKVTDGLITNFHLPKSTLLMLVSALVGHEQLHKIYDHAVSEEYRFFSYGDASLLLPKP